jgi:3-hydroxyacyl-[acyl-carrier-protein] dehydratase
MDPSDFEIITLIPQRPPMQMIDRLDQVSEKGAKGRLFINEDNVFVRNGNLSESALIEFIAQTAAAYTGYNNFVNKSGIKEGYIGSVKNLIVHDLPPVLSEISSEIEVINEIIGFTIITGKVYSGNKILAECEMRILAGN